VERLQQIMGMFVVLDQNDVQVEVLLIDDFLAKIPD
jgi:hypothetical protein